MTPKDLERLRIDRSSAPTGTSGGVRVLIVLLLLLLAFLLWNQFRGTSASTPAVEVGRVLKKGGAKNQTGVAANGYVVARVQAALSTDIQGRLVSIPVEEGDRVTEGQVIAQLDTSQLEASKKRAHADLAAAQADAKLAKLELERQQKLISDGHTSASERDTARATLDRSLASILAREAEISEIDVMINKSAVYAPFDGIVVEKNAEVGEVVSSIGSGGNARGSVATLVDFRSLEVQVELAQTSLNAAREGAPVLIYLDAYPERAYKGNVRQIWPTANRQKATVELRATFVEKDQRVLPEMGVRVVFTADDGAEAKPTEILLPSAALVRADPPYVFLFQSGAANRREVTVDGEADNGYVRVTSGLRGQELVVLRPPSDLQDGDPVERREENR